MTDADLAAIRCWLDGPHDAYLDHAVVEQVRHLVAAYEATATALADEVEVSISYRQQLDVMEEDRRRLRCLNVFLCDRVSAAADVIGANAARAAMWQG